MSGHVWIDEKGDRQPDYWLWDYHPDEKSKIPVLHISINNDVRIVP
jgi:hypothetical protein